MRFKTGVEPRQYSSSPFLRRRVLLALRQCEFEQAPNAVVEKNPKLITRYLANSGTAPFGLVDVFQEPIQARVAVIAGNALH